MTRTVLQQVNERICFELDDYDRHRVSQQAAEEDPFVWRVNLLGGGRLLAVSQRLRRTRTLAQYVRSQGWDYGEGFIVGNCAKLAPFLTGKPLLPTPALTTEGIDEPRLGVVCETQFERPRREELYTPPLVLLRENESLSIAFWDAGPLAYRDQIIGIHSPQPGIAGLRRFFETLRERHETYQFCCTLNGSKGLAGRATAIQMQDVEALPYPEEPSELALSFWEEAIRDVFLEYIADYVRPGQNSELLRREAGTRELQTYSELFCHLLGSVYENLRADEPAFLNGLICQPFYFGERPDASWLTDDSDKALRNLVCEQNHEHLRTVRVLRFYEENALLIVKPDRLRYWIRSTAIRDADETLMDLRRQGY